MMRTTALIALLILALSPTIRAQDTTAELPIAVGAFEQQVHTAFTDANGLPAGAILHIDLDGAEAVATSAAAGSFRLVEGAWRAEVNADEKRRHLPDTSRADGIAEAVEAPGAIRQVVEYNGEIGVAADNGLYIRSGGGNWALALPRDGARRWAPVDVRAVAYDVQGRLWFACPQGVGYRVSGDEWKLFSGADGLPFNDFTCMAAGPKGVWFGTTNGAIHFEDGAWTFRQGRKWLVDNYVNDLAVAPDGTVWLATNGGVSVIGAYSWTLAEKAQHFEEEIDRYHRRTSFEYVSDATMSVPGDKTTAKAHDTDNDGHFTGIYLGSASLGWAVTRDPAQKKKAHKAFEALAFLSTVTEGGTNPAPKGFIARAVRPTDGPDPNEGLNPATDRDRRENRDALWKIMDPRWPVDETGEWYWKCDSSSDELDGYYFGFGIYYDHVVETEAEKERLREVVRRMTDHLLIHDYNMVDHDGTPTRWGHFSPKDLNQNEDWWIERGLNSQSILTFLTVAHHITGDQKYRDAYLNLAIDHGYAMNVMTTMKIQNGPGSLGQADDHMAFMNYYHLIRYETDPGLLSIYYNSIYWYWLIEKYERNAFMDFVYAACVQGKTRTDHWRTLDLSASTEELALGVDALKRYPLDLIQWPMSNAHRLDLVGLGPHTQGPGGRHVGKGHHRNGYVYPIDENHAFYWGDDPWHLTSNGDGTQLNDPVSYLVAYYLGVHHGIIAE